MQEKTYSSLLSLVKALSGVNEFTNDEETYIINFANRRAQEAYDSSEYWSRYLVAGESRTVDSNQVISFTETGKTNIGDFLRIHRTQPFLRNSAVEYDFFVDANGAHIINMGGSSASSAFVTYKKRLGEITITSTDIPLEFFYFIAHATYADFLRMDGQTDKAVVEEQIARQYLDAELGKLDIISNTNMVGKKISTYVNRQSR